MERSSLALLALAGTILGVTSSCSDATGNPAADPATVPLPASPPPAPPPAFPEAGPPTTQCPGIRLPDDQHYAPAGVCVTAVATGQGLLRQIAFAPNGDLFGVRKEGEILRYRDTNRNGVFEPGAPETVVVANTGGGNGNNVHIDAAGGFIYAGTPSGVKRWKYSIERDDFGMPEDIVVGQPSTGTHVFHTVHVYDGWLYVHSGSADNFVAPALPAYDTERAVLKRFDLSKVTADPFKWTAGEVFAVGLRNMVGFTQHSSGRIYGVVNGMDNLTYEGVDIKENNPADEVSLIEQGKAYGYPYCFTAQQVSTTGSAGPRPVVPGTMLRAQASMNSSPAVPVFVNPHDDAWCAANATPPLTFTPAHEAALDIAFNEGAGDALPPEWKGGAFVALHGSWNRGKPSGYRGAWIPFDSQGQTSMPTVTADGLKSSQVTVFGPGKRGETGTGQWGWSAGGTGETVVRPVGVAVSPIDGALYVSSDNGRVVGQAQTSPPEGAIYRVALERRASP